MIKIEDVEIRDQPHLMDAEGCHDQAFQPTKAEIERLLMTQGYSCTDINIWFDKMQSLWRWTCKISVKPQSYYPSEVWFDNEADKLISDFIWAQRRSSDFPKVVVAIDSALALVKFLRENNFISVHTKDFYLTHNKLDSYWFGVEKSLLKKRQELKPKDWPVYEHLYQIVKEFADKKREQVFKDLDLPSDVKNKVLTHFGISSERYT